MSSEWILCKKITRKKTAAASKTKITKNIDGVVYQKCERCTPSGGFVVTVGETEQQAMSLNKKKKKGSSTENGKMRLFEGCIKKEAEGPGGAISSNDVLEDYNEFVRYEKYCKEMQEEFGNGDYEEFVRNELRDMTTEKESVHRSGYKSREE
jgi:hypothetical protein